MAGSKLPMPIGRSGFLIRFSLITVGGFALEYVLRRIADLNLHEWLGDTRALGAIVACLLAKSMIRTVIGRCVDADLPRWCAPIAYLAWIIGILLVFWGHPWPVGTVLIGIVVIFGGSCQGKPEKVDSASISERSMELGMVSNETIPLSLFIGPASFLRTLLTMACLGIPLVWLEISGVRPTGPLIARAGYSVLYFVWLFKVLGRLADSGHPSSWYWLPLCIGVTTIVYMPLQHHLTSRYEALALFLLIQAPLALLPSRHEADKFNEDRLRKRRELNRVRRERRVARWRIKDPKPMRLGPLAFVGSVLIIATLWGLFLFWEKTSGGPVVTWFARCCYLIMTIIWIINLDGRVADAGLSEGWYGSQFVLVVSVVSLMPLAFHWVNGYGALAIFILIQFPLAFLSRKPVPETVENA
jgi:hypothetical protein